MVAGRRNGKTCTGLCAVVLGHGPQRRFKGALFGAAIRWVAPTFGLSTVLWRNLKKSLHAIWTDKDEVTRTISLPGGGSIAVRSSDNPDSLRSVGSDGVVMDEAAFMAPDVWEEAIRPTLVDRQGWAMFLSTPKGKANWFYDLVVAAKSKADWEIFRGTTAENPDVPTAEIENARENSTSARFAQEYLGEFVSLTDGMFLRDNWQIIDAVPAGLVVAGRGWDFAASEAKTADESACVLAARTEDHRYVILDFWKKRVTPADRDVKLRKFAELDGDQVKIGIPEDPGSAGKDAALHIVRDVVPGFRVDVRRETGPKAVRAEPVAAQQKNKNIYLLRAPWNPVFINDCEAFPDGGKDTVDALSGTFRLIALKAPLGVAGDIERPERSKELDSMIAMPGSDKVDFEDSDTPAWSSWDLFKGGNEDRG